MRGMALDRDPSSHAPAGISAPVIADAALQIVREVGVERLSMRALAGRLGVRAPSLYHHIANKTELLRLVARHAFASFGPDIDAYEEVESLDDWIAATKAS